MEGKVMCLFDMDGTLTKSRQKIEKEHYEFIINNLKSKCDIGLVGGSDFVKICEQMNDGMNVINKFDYIFAENGLIYYQNGKQMPSTSILNYIGEDKLQEFINFNLEYLSKLKIPVKRGTFIEFRNGMINISPIGRNCSQKERDDFEIYDKQHEIRKQMINALKEKFPDIGFTYSIGGQISFDVFPTGWDKTFCLQYLENKYKTIHFFGDKTEKGGNDYEIFIDKRVIGHKVTNPNDTINQLKSLFNM